MTNHYFTASTNNADQAVILPFTGVEGDRLNWHRSDRVYFGNSLPWRRGKNIKAILPPTKNDIKKYCEVMKWAKSKGFDYSSGIDSTFYQTEWPLIVDSRVVYYAPKKVGSIVIVPKQCGVT